METNHVDPLPDGDRVLRPGEPRWADLLRPESVLGEATQQLPLLAPLLTLGGWWHPEGSAVNDGQIWGTSHALALVLASLQLDVVHRAALHEVMSARPTVSPGRNRRIAVRRALARLEQRGWIARDGNQVTVRDRRALLDHATSMCSDPDGFARIQTAVQEIRDAYNRGMGTPQAARAGRQRQELIRLATEPPRGRVP